MSRPSATNRANAPTRGAFVLVDRGGTIRADGWPDMRFVKSFHRRLSSREDPTIRATLVARPLLWLDGVHAHELGSGRTEFCEHGEVTDGDVAGLVSAIADRVLRLLRRVGKWPATGEAADSDDDATDLMLELGAAAVQGRTALGERAGALDARVGSSTRSEPFVKGPLCADMDGFSLHAAVRVQGRDRDRLEHLCRHAGRPAIAESRLSLLPDGRVAYAPKKRCCASPAGAGRSSSASAPTRSGGARVIPWSQLQPG